MSEWNDANPTKITGVRNLAVKEYIGAQSILRIIAVLETDQDS